MSVRARAMAIAVMLAFVLEGCAGSADHSAARAARASVCTARARTVVAQFLGVTVSRVSARATTANSGSPECAFTTRLDQGTVKLSVEVDTGPQPYAVLERTAIEASQMFTRVRSSPPPQDITGLGLDADWFPEGQDLMTTDGVRLIDATVDWPPAPQPRRRALAEVAARPYLGRLRPDLARGPAP